MLSLLRDPHCPGPQQLSEESRSLLELGIELRVSLLRGSSDPADAVFRNRILDRLMPHIEQADRLSLGVRKDFRLTLQKLLAEVQPDLARPIQEQLDLLQDSISKEVDPLRQELLSGRLDASALARKLEARSEGRQDFEFRFDDSDHFFDELLQIRPSRISGAYINEQHPYEPTPITLVRNWLSKSAITESDYLIDIGSGLGRVVMAAALLTPARVLGIELDSRLAAEAARLITINRIPRASIECISAEQADLSQGNIFFLFNPFHGNLFRTVLEKLRQVSENHPIQLVGLSLNSQRLELSKANWLRLIFEAGTKDDPFVVYESVGSAGIKPDS